MAGTASDGLEASGRTLLRDVRAALAGGCSTPAISILVEGDRVSAIGDDVRAAEADRVIEGGDLWALPALIDLQVNDAEWLAGGARTVEEHADRAREVAAYQARRGVTGLLLATLAAPVEEIVDYLRGLEQVRSSPRVPTDAGLLGALVEGTFMNPLHHGAHNPRWVLPPERDVLDRLIDTGSVRAINIAPEMAAGAVDLVRHAVGRGVVVACGHARPHAARLREAVDAGMSYVIHLGNGPTGTSLKGFDDGGMLEESLRNDQLSVTVIADGHHIHPAVVRDWIARKEVSRVVGISDAGFAMGPPEGAFRVFGVRGRVAPGREYLYVEPTDDAPVRNPLASDARMLFGSAIDQLTVFENLVNWLSVEMEGTWHRVHPALSLEGAILSATALCSTNPARLLGLSDRGVLGPGARADILLARIEGSPGAYRVSVEETLVGGVSLPRET